MPSVASFMMPAAKCVTAMPEDKLSSVVTSLVNEKIGCVVVVDPASERAVGIVTIEDLLEEVVGEIADEYDRENDPVEILPDGSCLVRARAEVKELNERFPWRLPEGDYETLGGLLLHHFER